MCLDYKAYRDILPSVNLAGTLNCWLLNVIDKTRYKGCLLQTPGLVAQHSLQFYLNNTFDWLADWLTDWLIDWLVDWLVGWLIDWLIDWFSEWVSERLTERLIKVSCHPTQCLSPVCFPLPKFIEVGLMAFSNGDMHTKGFENCAVIIFLTQKWIHNWFTQAVSRIPNVKLCSFKSYKSNCELCITYHWYQASMRFCLQASLGYSLWYPTHFFAPSHRTKSSLIHWKMHWWKLQFSAPLNYEDWRLTGN